MDKLVEVINRAAGFGFNAVHATTLPDGGILVMLSHRNTDDFSVTIRVRSEDVILSGVVDEELGNQTPIERETLRRVNYGGPWDAAMWDEPAEYAEWYRAESEET